MPALVNTDAVSPLSAAAGGVGRLGLPRRAELSPLLMLPDMSNVGELIAAYWATVDGPQARERVRGREANASRMMSATAAVASPRPFSAALNLLRSARRAPLRSARLRQPRAGST